MIHDNKNTSATDEYRRNPFVILEHFKDEFSVDEPGYEKEEKIV